MTVDYFPHIISKGKTLFILEENYGNDGYAFWFKILELLSSTKGHYYDCNNSPNWKFLLAKTRVKEDIAKEILLLLSELEAIDKDLWEEKIIFSQNFIDNIQDVYKRRGVNTLIKEEIVSLCKQKRHPANINVNKKPQIKLNEIKLNEIKEEGKKHKEKSVNDPEPKRKKINKEYIYTESFVRFWVIYPRRVNKNTAFESWKALNPNDTLVKTIINAVKLQLKYDMFNLSENKSHCIHPSTWLNNKRWEDEIEIEDSISKIGGMDALKRFAERHNVDMDD